MKKLVMEYDHRQIAHDVVTFLRARHGWRNQPEGDPLMNFTGAIATLAFAIFAVNPAAAGFTAKMANAKVAMAPVKFIKGSPSG